MQELCLGILESKTVTNRRAVPLILEIHARALQWCNGRYEEL